MKGKVLNFRAHDGKILLTRFSYISNLKIREAYLLDQFVQAEYLYRLIRITYIIRIGCIFLYQASPISSTDEGIIKFFNEVHLLNAFLPIIFTEGGISSSFKNDSKSADQKCYSKGGINIPVDSVRSSQLFNPENNPSYFILKVEQNVSMTNELKDVLNQAKDIVRSCDSRFTRVVDFYPFVEVDNLIKNGQSRSKSLSKKLMIASIFLGVGIYTELCYKSLPVVKHVQNSDVNVVSGFDYQNFFKN